MKRIEHLAKPLSTLIPNQKEIPAAMAVVIKHGGSRPAWGVKNDKQETMLMAWPQDSLLRTGVIITGKPNEKLEAVAVMPFLEGAVNELRVEKTYAWKNGVEGEVACAMGETNQLLWFYDPLYFRDSQVDLTEGVTQPFFISGICMGMRPALLDELTITQGVEYEKHATQFLQENPDKTRLDVPPLKVDLRKKRILAPSQVPCEYEARAILHSVEEINYGPDENPTKVYQFGVTFGETQFLHVMMFASERVCIKGYVPKEGDEVDMLFWMQGRVGDMNPEDIPTPEDNTIPKQKKPKAVK